MKSLRDLSGFWAILSAAVIYGSFGVSARYLDGAFGLFTQVLVRSAVALAIMVCIVIFMRIRIQLSRKDIFKTLLLGLLFFVGVALFTLGSIEEKISVVLFALYAGSFTASFFISTFVYHEKFTLQKGIALTLVVVGLLFTTQFSISTLGWGLLAAFISGGMDAFGNSIRKQLASLPKMEVLFVQFAATTALAFLAVVFSREVPIKHVTSSALVSVAVWGVLWVLVNQLIMVGFRHFDFMLGQIVLSSEIFFATVLAFLIFREVPNSFELVGGLLICIGVISVDVDAKRIEWIRKVLGER